MRRSLAAGHSRRVAGPTPGRTPRARGIVCGAVALAFVVGSLIATGPGATPASATTYPTTVGSYYEYSSNAHTIAVQCQQAAQAGESGVIILAWGRPAYHVATGNAYGTVDYGANFDNVNAILTAAENCAYAYAAAATGSEFAYIALGTSDDHTTGSWQCPPTSPCNYLPPSYTTFGQQWASLINTFSSYIATDHYNGRVAAESAMDMEPGWDRLYTNTSAMDSAYNSTVAGGYNWDFGSLDPGWWTNAQMWQQAQGYIRNFPFGQIFQTDGSQATEWGNLDTWSCSNEFAPLYINGVLTQYGGSSGTNTPHQGYDQMTSALASRHSSCLTQTVIPYLDNI
jgi:hypothetical protein